jgi:hypothetical protein
MGGSGMAPMPTHKRWGLLAWGLVLAAFACAPSAAVAQDALGPRAVEASLGEEAEMGGAGLYAVEGQGEDAVLSHGPDAVRALPGTIGGRGFEPGDPERAPVCGSDHYQRFFYARAPGAPDRFEQVKGQIQAAVRRMNAVLNAASLASGGGTADLRVLCDEAGEARVDRLVSGTPLPELMEAVEDGGFEVPGANYTVFYDGPAAGACGIATITQDERLAPDNEANEGGGYAVVYDRCWFNEGPMHEMAHNQGAVQYGAPHSTGSGAHCSEELDVLCYSPDGGDLNQGGITYRCDGRVQFDCGFDDYFDSAPEPGEYLAGHWNLGSPLNQFVSFGERPADADAAAVKLRPDRLRGEQSAMPGGSRAFWVRVPKRTRRLEITMRAPAGFDLDLYVGVKPAPGEETGYRCRSATGSAVERCVIRRPAKGRWYAGVPTVFGGAGAPFTVRARV